MRLTPGARVRRAFLPDPLYGEVITYNGALRVLRDDGHTEEPIGWYTFAEEAPPAPVGPPIDDCDGVADPPGPVPPPALGDDCDDCDDRDAPRPACFDCAHGLGCVWHGSAPDEDNGAGDGPDFLASILSAGDYAPPADDDCDDPEADELLPEELDAIGWGAPVLLVDEDCDGDGDATPLW